jgi:predicted small lipoprotein YifL
MIKKLISILLALTLCVSLAACGSKNEPTKPNDETPSVTEPAENTKPSTEPTEDPGFVPSPEVTLPEGETWPSENEDSDKETEPAEPQNPTVPDNSSLPQLKVSDVILADLKAESAYNGLYRITGVMSSSFGNSWSCSLSISGMDCDNSGNIDAVKAGIPKCISDIASYVCLNLKFDGDKMTCDVIERKSGESLLGIADEDIIFKMFPELKYDVVDAGQLPKDSLSLSQYEPGKMYAFKADESIWQTPVFNNDSEHEILSVTIYNRNTGEFIGKVFVPNLVCGEYDNDILADAEKGELCIAISTATFEELLGSGDAAAFKSQELSVGNKIENNMDDILCNDTDKTFVLDIEGEMIELAPGKSIYVDWFTDVYVAEIK